MSEVPEGWNLSGIVRNPPRPSATLMITRDGDEGVEVLLCHRVESMPAFPGYWAFPGGGVSRVDKAAVSKIDGLELTHAAVMREIVEELGLNPVNGVLEVVEETTRMQVVEDKSNWLPAVLKGKISADSTGFRLISERTTPPFGPMRFANSFLHIHSDGEVSLSGQTEFDDFRWSRPEEIISEWKQHEIKVAPPIVTLLMEVDRCLKRTDENMEEVAIDLEIRKPGRRAILFAHGVEVVPVPTATLPPADHTNSYLVGDPEGEYILVDPACRTREGMEALAMAIERHRGELIAILFTHSHSDHLADMGLLRELTDVPIWGSVETSMVVDCQRLLEDGEVLELGNQEWTVLITPGHCPGHTCLISAAGLVAGDMVAGIGTILIPPTNGDMDEYIAQLERLRDLSPNLIFPSHGPVIPLPDKKLNHYIEHRRKRHLRVLDAVNNHSDLELIADTAYSDSPDAPMMLAIDQTLAHLLALEKSGEVTRRAQSWFVN